MVEITVPDKNDSVSQAVLNGIVYNIRFTYNDSEDCWYFGLYDSDYKPLSIGVKIVPQFPLNAFRNLPGTPVGMFGVESGLDRIGRYDFRDGKAVMFFYSFI